MNFHHVRKVYFKTPLFEDLPVVIGALAASKRPFLAGRLLRNKFLKNSQKTLDFLIAICFNTIISLGAEEETHKEEERECVLFDSARFLKHIFSATLQQSGEKETHKCRYL
jgi:hypothetical protein